MEHPLLTVIYEGTLAVDHALRGQNPFVQVEGSMRLPQTSFAEVLTIMKSLTWSYIPRVTVWER